MNISTFILALCIAYTSCAPAKDELANKNTQPVSELDSTDPEINKLRATMEANLAQAKEKFALSLGDNQHRYCMACCKDYETALFQILKKKGLRLQPGNTKDVDHFYLESCERQIKWYEGKIEAIAKRAKTKELKIKELTNDGEDIGTIVCGQFEEDIALVKKDWEEWYYKATGECKKYEKPEMRDVE